MRDFVQRTGGRSAIRSRPAGAHSSNQKCNKVGRCFKVFLRRRCSKPYAVVYQGNIEKKTLCRSWPKTQHYRFTTSIPNLIQQRMKTSGFFSPDLMTAVIPGSSSFRIRIITVEFEDPERQRQRPAKPRSPFLLPTVSGTHDSQSPIKQILSPSRGVHRTGTPEFVWCGPCRYRK